MDNTLQPNMATGVPKQYTPDEFAQSIKAKYPQYNAVDNATLTQKMLAKYPAYASKVNMNAQPTQKAPMPLASSSSTNFGQNLLTSLKDVGTGAVKDLTNTAVGTAGLLQSGGKAIMGAFGADTSKLGFNSLDTSTPEGAGVAQSLTPQNRGEQVGGLLSMGAQLATPLAGGNAEALIAKGKSAYSAFTEARGAKLAAKEAQGALETIRPKLTPTMEAEAKAAGRGQTSGILKKTTIAPSSREVEMGQFAHEAGVSPSNTFDKNIQVMKDTQKTSAETLRAGLKDAPGGWTRNDVVGTLNKIEKPITIKSDTSLNKLADNFKKAIVQISEGSTKKPEGLLDLRQGVDNLVKKEFPENIYTKDTPVGQYIKKIRTALNDMAESKLPEGKLPNGSTFKEEMRRQHLLYDAIDNVAEKAPKVGESGRPIIQKAKEIIKKHPYISGGVTGAIGGGAVTGIIKNL